MEKSAPVPFLNCHIRNYISHSKDAMLESRKEIMLMTKEDMEQYLEVLLALNGYGMKTDESEKPCHQNCQSDSENRINTDF